MAGLLAAVTLAACSSPILANPPLDFPVPASPTPAPPRPEDPIAVAFPRDDGPHDRLTEWWYYTGHLRARDGRRFGFELVVFRAERSSVPVGWASHFALTDEQGNAFYYAQRSEIGPQVDRSPRGADGVPTGFDLQVSGLVPMPGTAAAAGASGPPAAPWRVSGANGVDRLEAALTPLEATAAGASYGISLDLRQLKNPALHDEDGFVEFGPAGSSYYYSRTRMEATGELTLDGVPLTVDGIAWFDHQWGDFVSVGGGGWDWFAVNLDDGTDLTVSVVRDAELNPVLEYGTLVTPSGEVRHLPPGSFTVDAQPDEEGWTSPATGLTWPNGWTIAHEDLFVRLRPTVAGQELDTRATTGVVYWEGSQVVEAGRIGEPELPITGGEPPLDPIGGEAYVEITRYSVDPR